MEIERYTLATGQTALAGFNRFWKHWGLVFAILVYFANLWPGWAMSAATLDHLHLRRQSRASSRSCGLLVIGTALTLAPVVYVALERLIFVKIAAVTTLVVLAVVFAISADSWRALPAGVHQRRTVPDRAWIRAAWWARSRLPALAADRISVRATGFATRGSAWGATFRGS